MELRSPDPSLNPYLAFALILAAGLDGIEHNMPLPPAVDADLYTAGKSVTDDLAPLPDSLEKAITLAEKSAFVKNVIGDVALAKYLDIKKAEAGDCAAARDKTEFYKERYFSVI
jgi:glutamine synthetase